MIQAELSRLRRLYQHVLNDKTIRPRDIALTIEFLEKQDYKYKTFNDWYNEVENLSLRSERLTSDVIELEAAFNAARMR